MENVPDGTMQTEIAEESPQGMERRLVRRLLSISDDGVTISGILGAVNCREIHEG